MLDFAITSHEHRAGIWHFRRLAFHLHHPHIRSRREQEARHIRTGPPSTG